MAEIEGGGGGGKKGGKPQVKKMSTRVDFTPMVDLGFLLITFFMLTTSMNKPQVMAINMPDKDPIEEDQRTKFKADQTVTLLLGDKDRIFYYFGMGDNNPEVKYTNYSKDGLRKMLLEEVRKRNPNVDSIDIYKSQLDIGKITEEQFKNHRTRIRSKKEGLLVMIKPSDASSYKNMVDVLDEMLICNVGIYAIVDISDAEKQLMAQAEVTAK